MSEEAQQVNALVTIKADPKWERRRQVIEALGAYKLRLDAKLALRERYEAICTQLYSGRSSRITGMPTNHDQFAAQDHFAEMLDEKMELERALASEDEDDGNVAALLGALDERSRSIIEDYYLSDNSKEAVESLSAILRICPAHVYRIRNSALDELAVLMGIRDNTLQEHEDKEMVSNDSN